MFADILLVGLILYWFGRKVWKRVKVGQFLNEQKIYVPWFKCWGLHPLKVTEQVLQDKAAFDEQDSIDKLTEYFSTH